KWQPVPTSCDLLGRCLPETNLLLSRSTCSVLRGASRQIRVPWIGRSATSRGGAGRSDTEPLVNEDRRYEEATAHHRNRVRGATPGALRRGVRNGGRLMFPTAVALPLALLPIVSLLVTLRWMAFTSDRLAGLGSEYALPTVPCSR